LTLVGNVNNFNLKKPSGFEFKMPIHKKLAINSLLRVGQKGPPGSDRVKAGFSMFGEYLFQLEKA